jgi:acyl-CoA synthetase (AMP-forming)/AMP-acid ligase II
MSDDATPSGTSEVANIAAALPRMAARIPEAVALQVPVGRERGGRRRYVAYTYRELDDESDRIARGLDALGVGRGVRAALLVTPSFEFFALVFGLFKAGAVPVLIDPGIGPKHVRACLDEAEPAAFIGIPKAHAARVLFGWAKRTARVLVTVGRRWGWGGVTLDAVKRRGGACGSGGFLAQTAPRDVAAILFTSGSTGAPKGVVYEHRHFLAQVELIRTAYGIEPGEVDVPTFPLFGLFDPALGMTTVLPDMDFTRPARVDPSHFIEIAERFGATNMFGSPAVLDTLGRYGVGLHATAARPLLATLRRVISAGAPVPGPVMERMRALLPDAARIHTPYGATETLPVATIADDVLLGETWPKTREGAGVCVGRPVAPNDVRVIRIDDGPLPVWADDLEVPAGTVGEITVLGPTTTEAYFHRDEATRFAKIAHGGQVRHRMGDLGYLDASGRIWFCGRKAHRVRTSERELYTAMVEGVFEAHPAVRRCALVGVGAPGAERPVVWLELEKASRPTFESLVAELRALGARHPHTAALDTFFVHKGFPVDIRHNAKIGYDELAREAGERLGYRVRSEGRR